MIKVNNLKKEYRLTKTNVVDALRGVSFEVGDGEVAALVGPSGSGKSTLLNILGGLDRDYTGEVLVNEKNILDYNSNYYRRHIVGTIFQQFYLIPSLDVTENIALPFIFNKKADKARTRDRVEYLIDKVGLSSRKHHKPKELSGGQAQRVAIARALVADPEMILADEPTGNLDTKTGSEIVELLFEINQESNTTMVIVTHDNSIIKDVAKKLHLKDGHITDVKEK